jgi:hypothetical protein
MTEPKDKVRICDLKPGDEFVIWGREKRVTSVNGVVRFVDTQIIHHGHANKIGAKSQQWVEVIRKDLPIKKTYTQLDKFPLDY